jgi:phage-related tail fiber protein
MQFSGINLVEGSEISTLIVASGSAFPSAPHVPVKGELFNLIGNPNPALNGVYSYNGADTGNIYNPTNWTLQLNQNSITPEEIRNILPPVSPIDPVSGLAAFTPAIDPVQGTFYTKVKVDSLGRVIGGSTPTTLGGYNITDAQPLDADLTAIAAISDTAGFLKKIGVNSWALDTTTYITQNQQIAVSGDATGFGTTSIALTLANSGVTAASYGIASSVPQLDIDVKGRVTHAVNVPIGIDASQMISGSVSSARISVDSVTQYQASLAISENQILDGTVLARVAGNETITGNWTFNNPVTGSPPTIASHLATKLYVDNVAAGLSLQKSVRVATTGPIVLSGLQTIDDIVLTAGDRVLVKDQSNAAANGIYTAASDAWARATDFDNLDSNNQPVVEIKTGALIYVAVGTSSGNSSWVLTTTGTITVDVTALIFTVFSRPGDFTAGAGLTLTGHTFDIGTASTSRIVVNADNIDLATTGVAAGNYAGITVDTYGRVTAGTSTLAWTSIDGKPTTLNGYGITDAQPLNGNLTSISSVSSTGLLANIGTNSFNTISLAVSGLGISITNPDGVSGNPTITSNATAANVGSTLVARDAAGSFAAGIVTADLIGNASTATSWKNARKINLSGDLLGSTPNIDGTSDVILTATLGNTGVTAGTYTKVTVDAKGRITIGTTISSADIITALGYTPASSSGGSIGGSMVPSATNSYTIGTPSAVWQNVYATTFTGNLTGNASTVTTNANLTGPITSVGNATSVASQTGTGSKFVMDTSPTIAGAILVTPNIGVATGTSFNSITGLAVATPLVPGAATVGTSTLVARQDHVHPSDPATAVTSGPLAQFASTTSAQLAGVISDETGTGQLVFNNGPLLVAPSIGIATGVSFNSITGLSSTVPLMDGTAAVGYDFEVARADHVHPSDTSKLSLSGGVMTGSITIPTGQSITVADTPTLGTQVANKNYVDAVAAGLTWKNTVLVATTTNITRSGTQTIDGIAVTVGTRVLVKNQTTSSENGIYVVSTSAWSRAADMDASTPINEFNGAAVLVTSGTSQSNTGWIVTSTVTTVDTSPVTWAQFSAAVLSAGTGVGISGNTISVLANQSQITTLGTITSGTWSAGFGSSTGTGAVVLSTSPTLVTPNLGTPSAVVLTNATGTANNLTVGNATYFSATQQTNPMFGVTTSMAMSQDGGATRGSVIVRASGTGDSNLAGMTFWNDAYAVKMGIRADGYFGLGGWNRAAWSWYSDPSGNMVAGGNVTAYSDPRLKENFKVIANPISILKQLDGGTFDWKSGIAHTSFKAGKHDYGILADQVEAVMPEIVTDSVQIDGDVYKTVDYSKIVPVLIEAIKALDARVALLENELSKK